MKFDEIDQLSVNAIRMLSCESIECAGSGHPGLPLGAGPMAYVLWRNHLCINPKDPEWFNRDRFVLSAGHGSAMLYSLLHLAGYPVSIDDLKQFRRLHSKTPGHPEWGVVSGVDASTGPLGQGLGMAVGMAMAEVHLGSKYNQEQTEVVSNYTYVLCGDGDLMEGISHEAASLAGHLNLNKLIVLYDSNAVSLDGPASMALSDDVGSRFEGYGWHYECVADGNDLDAIDAAITEAKQQENKPTLIEVKTVIGFGAPDQGTSKVHGTPIGVSGMAELRNHLNWTFPEFTVPHEVYDRFQETLAHRGALAEENWCRSFTKLASRQPELAQQLKQSLENQLPDHWQSDLPKYHEGMSEASRSTSHSVIQKLARRVPFLWGGSADLSSSNKTSIEDEGLFSPGNRSGRNIAFGVREFAEGAAMNGIMLHGGSRVFGGTFLVFSDYMRAAIRLSAMQKLPVIYVFTHDSIAVGEDGPTHQPVEQLMSLRAMPNVSVIRPADPNETVAAWTVALQTQDRPTVLILTRQNLTVLQNTVKSAQDGVNRGGYVLSPQSGTVPEGILIATGSEVHLAVKAQHVLRSKGHDVSVVSMPSFDRFNRQSYTYRESVLPTAVRKRMSIEMGATLGWERYVGLDGVSLGVDIFGASGAADDLLPAYGFTVERLVAAYEQQFAPEIPEDSKYRNGNKQII
ncbi:transketolase [Sporolactobacillus laevolacticus]|uniref:transketolase n=1 Tax=Sporolactobacillus laevolacticus TaxID=33018 RepID=UPI0025B34EBD|nr:transketolase [Sporolactobacillus laevolacticus]MDN3953705.1 transketolase [Sporolactobacillus laevolacticus]